MTVWIIEPQDPLIARDGRPFNATPGARARSLPFPYPSTTAGGVRTRAGQITNGRFDTDLIAEVLKIKVRGPLLAEFDEDEELKLMAPAPADALLFDEPDGQAARKQLRPLALPAGSVSDLLAELQHVVGLPALDLRKPSREAPKFWYWDNFKKWLLAPSDDLLDLQELGHAGPQADQRTHIAIDPQTLTSVEGMLFMTSGLTFWQNGKADNRKLSDAKRLALVVEAGSYNPDLVQADGYSALGGERRLMFWRRAGSKNSFPSAPPPPELVEEVARTKQCRLILLTPGLFTKGWKPDTDRWAKHNVQPQLVAAAVGKPAVVSGWDLKIRGPKPSRRLAPAGSVYFLHLHGEADDIRLWVNKIWLTNVSDDDADKAAGFGLAAIGVTNPARSNRFSGDTTEVVTTNPARSNRSSGDTTEVVTTNPARSNRFSGDTTEVVTTNPARSNRFSGDTTEVVTTNQIQEEN